MDERQRQKAAEREAFVAEALARARALTDAANAEDADEEHQEEEAGT